MNSNTELGKGPIGWMTLNKVMPNLLMIFLLLGGLYSALNIKKEVEQGIILVIEEAIQSVEGIDEISSTASEGSGRVTAELLDNADRMKVLQEIKQEIDRVSTFPGDAEEPVVSLNSKKQEVLQLNFYGDVSQLVLRELGEQIRDRLLQQGDISQVDIVGARDLEILIEVSQDQLRAHGLSMSSVAAAIKNASVEIPGGEIKTKAGEILLRVKDRRVGAVEFSRIPIITVDDGTVLHLGDIAQVVEQQVKTLFICF